MEKNKTWALNILALRCYLGLHVEKSVKNALYYYTLAAEKGDTFSKFNLAFLYMEGWDGTLYLSLFVYIYIYIYIYISYSLSPSLTFSFSHFFHLHPPFHSLCLSFSLTHIYIYIYKSNLSLFLSLSLSVSGTPRDIEKGIQLFSQAGEGGIIEAYMNIGYLYANGIGTNIFRNCFLIIII